MIYPGYPKDEKVLVGIGKVTIRHGQLDYAMKMCIKDFTGVSTKDALDDTNRQMSGKVRERVQDLAKQRMGESAAFEKLDGLLNRARNAVDQRNKLIHVLWASELDGDDLILKENADWATCPSSDDLEKLANEMEAISREIHEARKSGFIKAALGARALG